MAQEFKVQTVLGVLGMFIMTKPIQMFPWGDYYLDLTDVSEKTNLTKHEILQRLLVIWERDNTVL